MIKLPGSPYEQLWRDVFVAAIQGLSANPQLTEKSYAEISEIAFNQATSAIKAFQRI